MTLQKPVYDPNSRFKDFWEKFGHGVHEVVSVVVGVPVALIKDALVVRSDLAEQMPTLATDNGKVINDIVAIRGFLAAIALAASQEGVNVAEDLTVLAQLAINVPNLIQLVGDTGTLIKTLGTDLTTDAGQLKI